MLYWISRDTEDDRPGQPTGILSNNIADCSRPKCAPETSLVAVAVMVSPSPVRPHSGSPDLGKTGEVAGGGGGRPRTRSRSRARTRSRTGSPRSRSDSGRRRSKRSRSSSRSRSRRSGGSRSRTGSRSRYRRRSRSPRRRSRSDRRRSRSRSASEEELEGQRLHVADLDSRASKWDLEEIFKRFGPVQEIWMAKSVPCFAFVVFKQKEDASEACRSVDGQDICGRRVRVTMARYRALLHGWMFSRE